MSAATCPPQDELSALILGELSPARAETVEIHIETCATCQSALQNLDVPRDWLVDGLREAESSAESLEAGCQAAVDLIQRLAAETSRQDFSAGKTRQEEFPTVVGLARQAGPADAAEPDHDLGMIREYRLLAKLGEGGMGAVYKAQHTKLRRTVAVKVLPSDKVSTPQAVARFEREMQAVGALDHVNIVRAFDAGEDQGRHYLVMEYVKGRDVGELLRDRGPLPIAEACEIIRQAALGLAHAHEAGLVHRDIKPSNLMLAESGVVKVLDLGLARLNLESEPAAELTNTGQVMGTLDYMAPEQGGDTHHVDIRADIYSLGASLYRLLTGSAPFGDPRYDTLVKKMMALATKEPRAIEDLRPDVPKELAAVIRRMMAKSPDGRFATPVDVAAALAPFAAGAKVARLAMSVVAAAESPVPATALSDGSSVTLAQDVTTPQVAPGCRTGEMPEEASAENIDPSRLVGPLASARINRMKVTLVALAAGALSLAAVVYGAVVFYWPTPQGTVKIEINDDKIAATFDKSGLIVTGADKVPITITAADKNGGKKSVPDGDQTLTITRGDFKFQTKSFRLDKKEKTVLRIELLAGEVKVSLNDQELERRSIDSPRTNVASPARYALAFDGDDKVSVSGIDWGRLEKYTIEAYVRVDRLTDKVGYVVNRHNNASLAINFSTYGNWFLSFKYKDEKVPGYVYGGVPAELKKRVHLAGVASGRQFRLFADGKLIGTNTASQELEPGLGESLSFGSLFHGTIDGIRISKVARYDKDFAPPVRMESDADTLALYRFDEGAGDVLTDSSGNNHHGKIVGAKWVRLGEPGASAALESLRRDQIPPEALKLAGDGDSNKAPANLVAVLGEARPSHAGEFWGMAFSPDGRWLATGNHDRTILVRDVATGRVQHVLKGHSGPVMSLAFSKDSRTLVSASHDGTLKFWPIDKEEDPQTVPAKLGTIWGMAVSTDNRFLAAGGTNGQVHLWKWGQWDKPVEITLATKKDATTRVAFSPDGELLAVGRVEDKPDVPVRIFATTDGKLTGSLVVDAKKELSPFDLNFSRDGKKLACFLGDHKAVVWDVASGELAAEFPAWQWGTVTFSPDGQTLHVGGMASIVQSDLASRKVLRVLSAGHGCAQSAALSPDGKVFAAGFVTGMLHVWDTATWQEKYLEPGHLQHVRALAFSPDGRRVLSAGNDDTLRLWDLARPGTNQIVHQFAAEDFYGAQIPPGPTSVAYSPDGKMFVLLVRGNGFLRRENQTAMISWDAATLKKRWTVPEHLDSIAFSPDSKTIAGACTDGTVRLWGADLGTELHRFASLGKCAGVAFSGDGQLLAAASWDKDCLKIWNVASGAEVHSWQDKSMTAVALRADGQVVAAGHKDGTISVWDLAEGNKKRTLTGHLAQVQSLKFSPAGQTLFSSGHDGMIRVWNPQFERAQQVIPVGPANQHLLLDLDPSGQFMIAAGHGSVIYVLRRVDALGFRPKLPPPLAIPEPPPLAEWLKGRTVLTVSQHGKGQFKTIQAALEALKPGEVVKVLDKGPYYEQLKLRNPPRDTGLISDVNSVVELRQLTPGGWKSSDGVDVYDGHLFQDADGFRLHGLHFLFPAADELVKAPGGFVAGGLKVERPAGFVLENCRMQGRCQAPTWDSVSLVFLENSNSRPPCIRDCLIEGGLRFNSHQIPASLLVTRNYLLKYSANQRPNLKLHGPLYGQVAIRHNVFDGKSIGIDLVTTVAKVEALELSNNLLTSQFPIMFGGAPPTGRVVIQNNISTKPGLVGFQSGVQQADDATSAWQVGHNAYPRLIDASEAPRTLPKGPGDVQTRLTFLSHESTHSDYFRVPLDSNLAAAGMGGAWPSYIGALAPGPAPKEGDWFTRLRERWGGLQPAASAPLSPPLVIPEPPPLAEWLKGRTILTVSQDGKGQFETIQAALEALKPGEVVKVLDKGPYRENLRVRIMPDDTGLVSDQGTILDLPGWQPKVAEAALGHWFGPVNGFRLSGLRFRAPNVAKGQVTRWDAPAGLVIEDCCFQPVEPPTKETTAALPIALSFTAYHPAPESTWVRRCLIEGECLLIGGNARKAVVVVEHNYFKSGAFIQSWEQERLKKLIVRHNVAAERLMVIWGSEDIEEGIEISNNTSLTGISRFVTTAPAHRVTVLNNFMQWPIQFVQGAEQNLRETTKSWNRGWNWYEDESAAGNFLSRNVTDRAGFPRFLSVDAKHRDFLRIATDGPLVDGAGGDWPSHIGALLPGPAPKDGDWFTRLRERWDGLQPAASAPPSPPLAIPEPPPLAEWLKGRKVLTVSQNGKGQFKTIQAALEALQPGQVVKVLDKGPYRERLEIKSIPKDTGLVSDVSTILTAPDWKLFYTEKNPKTGETTEHYKGHMFEGADGFRLHGFEMHFAPNEDKFVRRLVTKATKSCVMENCLFHSGEALDGESVEFSDDDWASKDGVGMSVFVRECVFEGSVVCGVHHTRRPPDPARRSTVVFERNLFQGTGTDHHLMFAGTSLEKVVIRHNVFAGKTYHDVVLSNLGEPDTLELSNNTFNSTYGVTFPDSVPEGTVTLRNNLRTCAGLILLSPGARQKTVESLPNWRVDHNVFLDPLPKPRESGALPGTRDNLAVLPRFLSKVPQEADYLRIAVADPAATGGAGGDWPTHIGALPPGPAPKDGDWFTKLREKWPEMNNNAK